MTDVLVIEQEQDTYRARCPECGFVTTPMRDAVWARVVGERHRCPAMVA